MIAIACDHGGFALKEEIKSWLTEKGIEFEDFGCNSTASVDYADFALPAAEAVASGKCEKGILICGTGIGISMAANKVRGIRAACCSDCFSAEMTRLHNDANILCMGGRVVGAGLALKMIDLFLHTEFEGGRHATRIAKIADIEKAQYEK